MNRLTGITYSDAPTTPNVTFSYDGNGNRTSITDGAGSVSYTYDPLNRLSEVTRGADTFGYGYDPAGNVTRRTYPDSTVVTYTYDGANRLATAKVGTATSTYGYDAASNLASITLPNTVKATLTYDRAGRLTSIANKKGNKAISSFTYTLDPVGNPKTVVTPAETITYTFDLLDRLTKACYLTNCSGTGLAGIEYTYDGVGNRLTEMRDGSTPSTTTYTYNVDDQLTSTTGSAGTTTYGYDANGNENQAGSRTLSYDLANRLTSTTDAGVTESYTYDGDGNRLTLAQNGAVQTRYQWDTNNPLSLLALERDGAGALRRRYVNGHGPISMTTGGTNHYFLTDALGSVVNLTDASGAKEWSYSYEPYGTARSATKDSSSAPPNLLRFTGQLLDQTTDLYDLRVRMFDTTTGRFLQVDPVPSPSDEVQSASCVYVGNRPTVLVDPLGAAWWNPWSWYRCYQNETRLLEYVARMRSWVTEHNDRWLSGELPHGLFIDQMYFANIIMTSGYWHDAIDSCGKQFLSLLQLQVRGLPSRSLTLSLAHSCRQEDPRSESSSHLPCRGARAACPLGRGTWCVPCLEISTPDS